MMAADATSNRKAKLESELSRIVPLLRDRFNARLVVLFGSVAADRVSEWSDLDLVVVRDTPLRFLDRIGELLLAIRPKVGVDFLVYTPAEWDAMKSTNPFVKDEILRHGRILHAA